MRHVIIGHGRSPVGRKWGALIDGCDFVYRLWDCQWQNAEDYGTRYDYGYLTAHFAYLSKMQAHNSRHPRSGWIGEIVSPKPVKNLPPRTRLVDPEPWAQIGRDLGGVGLDGRFGLTRGGVLACYAISWAYVGDEIILVGFDNFRERRTLPIDKAFPDEFRTNPGTLSFDNYGKHPTKDGPHDFAVEPNVVVLLANARNVSLSHALDVWPC